MVSAPSDTAYRLKASIFFEVDVLWITGSSPHFTLTKNWLLSLPAFPPVFNNPQQKSIFHLCICYHWASKYLFDILISKTPAKQDLSHQYTEAPAREAHLSRSFLLSSLCMRKLTDSGNPAADNLFGHFEVIGRLQIDPVLRRLTKGLAEK
jgi:hypothetical protein